MTRAINRSAVVAVGVGQRPPIKCEGGIGRL